MNPEHLVLLPPWSLPGERVGVGPDDFAISCDLTEGAAGAVTDEGVFVGQPLSARDVGSVEILRILGRVTPRWFQWTKGAPCQSSIAAVSVQRGDDLDNRREGSFAPVAVVEDQNVPRAVQALSYPLRVVLQVQVLVVSAASSSEL